MKFPLYSSTLKRACDISAAVVVGVVTLPISIGAAIAVKCSSKGPILFKQKRLTLNEEEFEIYKFRSMYVEAPSLPPYMLNDPNAFITPVGKWLRKTSIDELPQLINVLKGEMSFVGPRPGAAKNEEELRLERRKRGVFNVRPGITGWAQVNGRDELAANPAEKAEYDAFYANNISPLFDLRCLVSTVTTVVTGSGYQEGSRSDSTDDKPKKLLFLIHTLGGGGAEKVLIDLVTQLSNENYDITVMTVIDTGIYKDRLPAGVQYKTMLKPPSALKRKTTDQSGTLNAKASRLSSLLANLYGKAWQIAPTRLLHKIFIREAYDAEIAFLEGIPAKLIASSPNHASRKLCWVHTDFRRNHKSEAFFRSHDSELRTYGAFDDVVFVSDEVKEGFTSTLGTPVDSSVINNPINLDEISRLSLESQPFKKEGAFNICTVGRLMPVKALDRLIEICNELQQEGMSFTLNIVGDGQERDNLQALAANNPQVVFHGYQSNPYPYISNADLFLIPSHAEGFSTVMVEALALGTPVLSTEVSGSSYLPPELVVANNKTALKEKIAAIVTDPTEYAKVKSMSKQGQDKVLDSNVAHFEEIQQLFS